MKKSVVFGAFYVVAQGNEFGWLQGTDIAIENVLFALR